MEKASNNSRPIKVITFDLDDTLWDIKPVLLNAEHLVFNWLEQHAPKLTQHFSPQSLVEWRGQIYQQQPHLTHQISQLRISAMQQAMLKVGYTPEESLTMAQRAFAVFIEARHQIILFDTVVPMLEQLHGDYCLGVLTNGNADVFRLDIGRFFDFAFSAEQLNASKPAPDHFLAAQHTSGAQPQQMIHIGDHIDHDINAALKADWHAIWFNPKQQDCPEQLKTVQGVHSLADIPKAISAIEKTLMPTS